MKNKGGKIKEGGRKEGENCIKNVTKDLKMESFWVISSATLYADLGGGVIEMHNIYPCHYTKFR